MKGISVALRSQSWLAMAPRARRSSRKHLNRLQRSRAHCHGRPDSLRLMKEASEMTDIPTPVAEPQHVRAAPPHSDPYPYYGRLARERKFFRDEVNGWWVAASAAAVNAVLTSELCLT